MNYWFGLLDGLLKMNNDSSLGSAVTSDATVDAIDWLELHAEGHRRAIFDARGARWVQP